MKRSKAFKDTLCKTCEHSCMCTTRLLTYGCEDCSCRIYYQDENAVACQCGQDMSQKEVDENKCEFYVCCEEPKEEDDKE